MSVAQRLRETLADDRWAMPGWPDPAARIAAGVARRRQRRHAVVAAAALALVAVAGGAVAVRWTTGPFATDRAAATDGIVPWRDLPAPAPDNLARRDPRPDARDCRAADLNELAWVDARTGTPDGQRYTVLLPNESDSRCTLRGSATVIATSAATGRRVTLPIRPVGDVDGVSQTPATVDPGEPARIDLVTAAQCPPRTAPAVRYRDVALVVLGREFPISAFALATRCPLGVGVWRVRPPLLNVGYQVASIQAPARVRRGEPLEYVVTVLNSGGRPFALHPCPVYTQRLGQTASTYRLNCAVAAIAPHRSVRFQMRMLVPRSAPLGRSTLTWMAVVADGEVIVADLATGGVPVEIVP